MSPNIISERDGICNSSANFFTSSDFIMQVWVAVTFQDPKEKSRWLLWKLWIIMAEVGLVWVMCDRLEWC